MSQPARLIVAAVVLPSLLAACVQSQPIGARPDISTTSGQFDKHATDLCRDAGSDDALDGELSTALDTTAAEVLAFTPDAFLPEVKDVLHSSDGSLYVAACFFLQSPPESGTLIVGVLESGEVFTLNEYD